MPDRSAPGKFNARQVFVVALLGGLIAVGLVIMGTALSDSHARGAPAGWITTTGRIIGLGGGYGQGGAPIIAFRDRAGGRFTFQARAHVTDGAVGSTAAVAYDPGDPNGSVDIAEADGLWPFHFALGLLFAVAGGWGLWRIRSNRKLREAFATPTNASAGSG